MECGFGNREFERRVSDINSSRKRSRNRLTCSKKCASSRKSANSLAMEALKLAKLGKTYKEIAIIMNKPQGTIASWLNKIKYRKYSDGGNSYASIRKKLRDIHTKCKICDFTRIVEIAHIIPASKGGPLTEDNTLGLCPTHHHLFDHKKLLKEEAEKLKDKIKNYQDFIIRDSNV